MHRLALALALARSAFPSVRINAKRPTIKLNEGSRVLPSPYEARFVQSIEELDNKNND
jgi:hypothetical protein